MFANRTRPCLLYQIKRCSGPCVDYIAPEDYARDVANAERFLRGRAAGADGLAAGADDGARRGAASSSRRPSCATRSARCRAVLHQQSVEDNTGARPATPTSSRSRSTAAAPASTWRWCAAAATSATGRISRSTSRTRSRWRRGGRAATRASAAPQAPPSPEVQVLEAFIAQHYLDGGLPPLLVVSHAVDKALIEALAAQQRASSVTVQHQPREQRRAWLDMCIKGAELRLAQLLAEEGSQQARTRALVDALDLAVEDLTRVPHRVLRHQPHRRRGDPGVVRRLRGAQDAERAVPPLQHRRHHAGRRLRRDAPGADAPLRQAGRGGEPGRLARLPDLVLVDGGAARSRGARGVRGAGHRARRGSSASRRARAARSASRSWCSPTAGRRSTSAATRRR